MIIDERQIWLEDLIGNLSEDELRRMVLEAIQKDNDWQERLIKQYADVSESVYSEMIEDNIDKVCGELAFYLRRQEGLGEGEYEEVEIAEMMEEFGVQPDPEDYEWDSPLYDYLNKRVKEGEAKLKDLTEQIKANYRVSKDYNTLFNFFERAARIFDTICPGVAYDKSNCKNLASDYFIKILRGLEEEDRINALKTIIRKYVDSQNKDLFPSTMETVMSEFMRSEDVKRLRQKKEGMV